MVPSSVIFLDALPDVNGKIDRRALPPPRRARPAMEQPYTAPANEIEADLVAIWEEVLGVHPIGVHDAFPDLGGHSIAAMQVLSRSIQKFAVDIPLKTIFDAPTITAFAQRILALRAAKTDVWHFDEALANIESLSDEDAAVVLAGSSLGKRDGSES
jgi:tyrocidine synthetase-3